MQPVGCAANVALPISMPRLKGIFLNKIALKLSYSCKKMQNFLELRAPPRDPPASGGWGLRPQTPKTAPIANFLLRA